MIEFSGHLITGNGYLVETVVPPGVPSLAFRILEQIRLRRSHKDVESLIATIKSICEQEPEQK